MIQTITVPSTSLDGMASQRFSSRRWVSMSANVCSTRQMFCAAPAVGAGVSES